MQRLTALNRSVPAVTVHPRREDVPYRLTADDRMRAQESTPTNLAHGSTQDTGAETDLRNGIDGGDPLTAKGRTKKRQRQTDSFDPDDPDRYRYKAYHIRRAFDLFGHIPTIVNDGIKRRAKEALGEVASDIQSDQDYETFNLILNHLDGLSEDIIRLKRSPKEFRVLIRKIREAADQARNNDTANLKKDIACMLTPDGSSVLTVMAKGKRPSSKHDRGFENDVMGRYLCPISLDWDDAEVRKEIREGKHAILACDWPRLLYANCDCVLDDLELGLGRNMALLRVVKYLFTGRSAAFSETAGGKTTRSGNAALAGMTELRYAISNEETWSAVDNEFNLQEFYWNVVSIFDDSDAFGKDLLAWWNMKVFGRSLETTFRPAAPCTTVAISLLKSQRAERRASSRILGDLSNVQRDRFERRSSVDSEDADYANVFGSQASSLERRLGSGFPCRDASPPQQVGTQEHHDQPGIVGAVTQTMSHVEGVLHKNTNATRDSYSSAHRLELPPIRTYSPSAQGQDQNRTARPLHTSYAPPYGPSPSTHSIAGRAQLEPRPDSLASNHTYYASQYPSLPLWQPSSISTRLASSSLDALAASSLSRPSSGPRNTAASSS